MGEIKQINAEWSNTSQLHLLRNSANIQLSGEFIVLCAVLIITSLGTIVGNLLVILAVGLVKKLRTPSNFLIVSLAVSDFLVGLLVIPLASLPELFKTWPLSEAMCDLFISFDVFMCTASILNLCAISIDRYLAITKPLRYAAKRTPKRMMAMIFAVWLASALISIPPMFGFKETFIPGKCEYSSNIIYQIYATCCAFYIPLIVMLILYGRIFILARHMAHADKMQKRVTESIIQTSYANFPPDSLNQTTNVNNSFDSGKLTHNSDPFRNGSIDKSHGSVTPIQQILGNASMICDKYPLPPSELCRRRKPRPLHRFSYSEEIRSSDLLACYDNAECSSMISSLEQSQQRAKKLKQMRAEFFAAPHTRHSTQIIFKSSCEKNLLSGSNYTQKLNEFDSGNINPPKTKCTMQYQPHFVKPNLMTEKNENKEQEESIFTPPLLSVSHYFDGSNNLNSPTSHITEVTTNNDHFELQKQFFLESTPLVLSSYHYPGNLSQSRSHHRPFHSPRRSFTITNEYSHRPYFLGISNYGKDRRSSSPSTAANRNSTSWNHFRHRSRECSKAFLKSYSRLFHHSSIFNVTEHDAGFGQTNSQSRNASWIFTRTSIKKRSSRHHNETKAIKTLGIIMGCFCLCWIPFFIIALAQPMHKVVVGKELYVPDSVNSLFLWLGYLNSTINPIIYVIFNRDFRVPFREIILCRCRGINARLRSQKYALEYGLATSNASNINTNCPINENGNSNGYGTIIGRRRSYHQVNLHVNNTDNLPNRTNFGNGYSVPLDNLGLTTIDSFRRHSHSVTQFR